MNKINIQEINVFDFESNSYSDKDIKLLNSVTEDYLFNPSTDFIEAKIYDESQNFIYSSGDYTDQGIYTEYSIINNDIELNVEEFFKNTGYTGGIYYVIYNYYRKLISDNNLNLPDFFISEIDSTRTELRLTPIENITEEFLERAKNFISEREESNKFIDFLISIGNSNFLCNNIALDDSDILVKLYEPLESQIDLKTEVLLIQEINIPSGYKVEIEQEFEDVNNNISIKGPNFNISTTNYSAVDSEELSLFDLKNTLISNMKTQLDSYNNSKEHKLNIDYSDFKNFIHFSSAYRRLFNFIEKLNLIKYYEVEIMNELEPTRANSLRELINDIIKSFDGYEYYLYFDPKGFPKDSTGNILDLLDPTVENWVKEIGDKALNYDEYNMDYLFWNIPEYLREDPENDQYKVFIDMIGHSFDDIWVYIKNIENIYDGDNRVNVGISKDLLTKILNHFGMKVYSGSYTNNDLYSAILGRNNNITDTPYNNITFTSPAQPGKELIVEYYESEGGELPLDDIEYRIYKRLYHNLPFLFKGRGTTNVVRTIINIYGIPDSVLSIKEHGNINKINTTEGDLLDNILSSTKSIQKTTYDDRLENNFDKYVEIGLSPADQINNHIFSTLNPNIEDLIGDPRNFSKEGNKYSELVDVRDQYFEQYLSSYNLTDFIRLVKYINNSLFKLLKDFVPANTTASTGIIIKSHELDRNKISPLELDIQFLEFNALMKSGVRNYKEPNDDFPTDDRYEGSTVHTTSGGTGGSPEKYNSIKYHPYYSVDDDMGVTQKWKQKHKSISGLVVEERVSQREFYDGEFGLPVEFKNKEICRAYFSNENIGTFNFKVTILNEFNISESQFLDSLEIYQGELLIYVINNKPKYIKISHQSFDGTSISDFIYDNTLINLYLEGAMVGSNLLPVNGSFSFYISNIINVYNNNTQLSGYTLVLNQSSTSPVWGLDLTGNGGVSGSAGYSVTAEGKYIWEAKGNGVDPLPELSTGYTQSIPHGYFPKTPDYPKEQFFKAFGQSSFYIGSNDVYYTESPNMTGTVSNYLIGRNRELDRDSYNLLYNNVPNPNMIESIEPWFMDNDIYHFEEIPSSSFIQSSSIPNNAGYLDEINKKSTFLGIEFTPIDINYYLKNVFIYMKFPPNNNIYNNASLHVFKNSQTYNLPYIPDGVEIIPNSSITAHDFANAPTPINPGSGPDYELNPNDILKMDLNTGVYTIDNELKYSIYDGNNNLLFTTSSIGNMYTTQHYLEQDMSQFPTFRKVIISASVSSPHVMKMGLMNATHPPTDTYDDNGYQYATVRGRTPVDLSSLGAGTIEYLGQQNQNYSIVSVAPGNNININGALNVGDSYFSSTQYYFKYTELGVSLLSPAPHVNHSEVFYFKHTSNLGVINYIRYDLHITCN